MFFNIHSPCSMYQHFVYFNYWIVVRCVERLHSIVDGHLGCFHVLAIMNNVTVNIYVQAFVWTYVFSPLGYISMSQTAAMWQFCFEFWETILLFSYPWHIYFATRLSCTSSSLHLFLSPFPIHLLWQTHVCSCMTMMRLILLDDLQMDLQVVSKEEFQKTF